MIKIFRSREPDTNVLLEGMVFTDGTTIARWHRPGKPNSWAIFYNFEEFELFMSPKKVEVDWVEDWTGGEEPCQ
jgi:hypothetical protein